MSNDELDARGIFDAYFQFFAEETPRTFKDYEDRTLWTSRATTALVHVGRFAFPNAEICARGHATTNPWGRSEYLTLDVTLNDRDSWAPPLFIAEHENWGTKPRIQYDAWKLLSVYAKRRVLVAYWGKGTDFKTFNDLVAAVKEVCGGQANKDILLIGGQANARPQTAEQFRNAHETSIVGVMRAS